MSVCYNILVFLRQGLNRYSVNGCEIILIGGLPMLSCVKPSSVSVWNDSDIYKLMSNLSSHP